MKGLYITLSLSSFLCTTTLMITCQARAQESSKVQYQVIEDNPDAVPDNYLYWHYVDLQGGMLNDADSRHSAASSIGTSLDWWQHFGPLVATANLGIGYGGEAAEMKKPNLRLDLGVAKQIGVKTKTKSAKVNVNSFKTVVTVEDDKGNFRGFANAVGVTQIQVPATYKLTNSVRAGVHYQNGTYDRNSQGLGTYRKAAVYLGYVQESKVSIVTQLLNRQAISSQYIRMYADFLLFPVLQTNIANPGKMSRLGMRFGALGSFPGMRNFMNYMTPRVEVGYDGIHGTYFVVGFGVDVFRW